MAYSMISTVTVLVVSQEVVIRDTIYNSILLAGKLYVMVTFEAISVNSDKIPVFLFLMQSFIHIQPRCTCVLLIGYAI